jgi:hypothetical protein
MASIINSTTTAGVTVTGDNSGSLQLATNNGTTAVTIDTSQRVLIGATSASGFDSGADNLIVGGGSGSNGITIYSGNTSTAAINFADGTTGSDIYAGGITYNHNTNNLDFSTTDGSGRMRITSAGNVIIGATTSSNTTRLGVVSSTSDVNTNTSAVTSTSGTRYHWTFQDGSSSSERGSITTNGTGTAYNSNSDYRLKENIAPMTGALAKVSLLKPCTYTWKVDGSDGQGFIAHELQAVVPDAVSGEKDAVNEDGSIKPQGVDTSFLVATLTAAIQELNAKVEAQAVRIAELEGAK